MADNNILNLSLDDIIKQKSSRTRKGQSKEDSKVCVAFQLTIHTTTTCSISVFPSIRRAKRLFVRPIASFRHQSHKFEDLYVLAVYAVHVEHLDSEGTEELDLTCRTLSPAGSVSHKV